MAISDDIPIPQHVPLSALSVKDAEIIVDLKLHECARFGFRVPTEQIITWIDFGHFVAKRLDRRLCHLVEQDHRAFEELREKARRNYVSHTIDEKRLATLMTWLAVHEPGRNSIIRHGIVQCLPAGRAMLQIWCREKLAYVTRVGVNPEDLSVTLDAAEAAPVPFAIMTRRH